MNLFHTPSSTNRLRQSRFERLEDRRVLAIGGAAGLFAPSTCLGSAHQDDQSLQFATAVAGEPHASVQLADEPTRSPAALDESTVAARDAVFSDASLFDDEAGDAVPVDPKNEPQDVGHALSENEPVPSESEQILERLTDKLEEPVDRDADQGGQDLQLAVAGTPGEHPIRGPPSQMSWSRLPTLTMPLGEQTDAPSEDLRQAILDNDNNETRSLSLGDFSLGGFLQLSDVTLDYSQSEDLVGIRADAATLFPGQPVTGSIRDGDDSDSHALNGSYSKTNETFSLTFDAFEFLLPEVLEASATGVLISYDTNETGPQQLVRLNVSAKLLFLDEVAVTLTDLRIRTDGFSIAAATATAPSFDLVGGLTVEQPTLLLTDVGYTSSDQNLTGTIGLASPRVTLFAAELRGFRGSYDLATRSLTLAADSVELQLAGGEVRLNASALNFELLPEAGRLAIQTGPSRLEVGESILFSGSFALETGSTISAVLEDSSEKQVSLTTIAGENIQAFFGIGEAQAPSGQIEETEDATGVALESAGFALAIVEPTDQTDSARYYALDAEGDVEIWGLPDDLEFTASSLSIRANQATEGAAIDFNATFQDGVQEGLSVPTGASSSRTLAYSESLLEASGAVSLNVVGVTRIEGLFVIRIRTESNLVLGGNSSAAEYAVMEIGASEAEAFVGVGGPEGRPGAVGLAASGVAFGLVTFRPTAGGAGKFALQAAAASVRPVGLPTAVSIEASDLLVRVNRTGGALAPRTIGSTTLEFSNADADLTLAQATLDLDVAGFTSVSGRFSVESATLASVPLDSGLRLSDAPLLAIGARDVSGFFGVAADQPDRRGFSVTVDWFALAIVRPAQASDARRWVSLSANLSGIESSGLEPLDVAADTLTAELNLAASDQSVVDFSNIDREGDGPDGGLAVQTGDGEVQFQASESLVRIAGQIGTLAVGDFVSVGGRFAIEKVGEQLRAVADDVRVTMELGTAFRAEATGGQLALQIDGPGQTALQAKLSTFEITAGEFADVTAREVTVTFNSDPNAAVAPGELTIGDVTAPLDVAAGEVSFAVQDLRANFANFVRIEGDFAFRRSGGQVVATANGVGATLSAGDIAIGVADGALALVINADGTKALDASGNPVIEGLPFDLPLTTDGLVVRVQLNDSPFDYAAEPLDLNIGGVEASLAIPPATQSVSVTGLEFAIADFVSLSGDFAFRKSGVDLQLAASDVQAALSLADPSVFSTGISDGRLGILLPAAGGVALQASGSAFLDAADFASVSVQQATIKYNTTGIDFSADTGAPLDLDIDGIGTRLDVGPEQASVSVVGLQAEFGGFVTLAGDFAFAKDALQIRAVATGMDVSLELGDPASPLFSAGVRGGDLAFLINQTENGSTLALQASGAAFLTAADFADVRVASAAVKLNTTGGDVSEDFEIDGIAQTLDVAAGEQSVAVTGLSANFANFVTIEGDYAFRKTGSPQDQTVEVAAAGVTAKLTLGDFEVGVTDGTLALLINSDGTNALQAGGRLILAGADFLPVNLDQVQVFVRYNTTGQDFSGDQAATVEIGDVSAELSMGLGSITSPLIGVTALGLEVDLGGLLTLRGDFSFARETSRAGAALIKVGIAGLEARLGDGNTDYVVIDGEGALLINDTGVAAQFDARATFQNLPGVTVDPVNVQVAINNTPAPVRETFAIDQATFDVDLPAGPLVRVAAGTQQTPLAVTLGDLTLRGSFLFERSVRGSGQPVLIITASGIGFEFSGEGTDGDTIDITDARGIFVVAEGIAGSLQFTTDVSFGGFEGGGTFKLEINNGASSIDVAGPFGAVVLPPGPLFRVVISDLAISFPGVEIEGDFSFQQAQQGNSTLQVIVGTNVRLFVGSTSGGPIGVELTGGSAVLLRDGNASAGLIRGRVQLLGVDGLLVDATMTVRINGRAGPVDESFVLDGEPVDLRFEAGEVLANNVSFVQVAGEDVTIEVAETAELRGDFTFTRMAPTVLPGKFLIGVADGEVFVGSGPSRLGDGTINPQATGVLVRDVSLGLAMYTSGPVAGTFAFDGSGTLSLLGVPGLELPSDFTFGLRLNRTGRAIAAEQVPILGGETRVLSFSDGSPFPQFKGGVRLGVPGVFTLEGTMSIRRVTGGRIGVIVGRSEPGDNEARLAIQSGSDEAFSIGGVARFELGGVEGFRLQDFQINHVSVFGETLIDGGPTATRRPPTADLASPASSDIVRRAELNERGYIDVVFNDVNGVGLAEGSITDPAAEFRVIDPNGIDITTSLDFTVEALEGNVYRYHFDGLLPLAGEYRIEFIAGTWRDTQSPPVTNLDEIEFFTALDVTAGGSQGVSNSEGEDTPTTDEEPLPLPPTARLVNPVGGTIIDPATLETLRFLDVAFSSRSGDPIDPGSIDGDELLLSGDGLRPAQLRPGPPIRIAPNTYRYLLIDPGTAGLFRPEPSPPSEVRVSFVPGSFTAGTGIAAVGNVAKTESITLDRETADAGSGTGILRVGPLTLERPKVKVQDLGFADGRLLLSIGLGVQSATLAFGGSGTAQPPQDNLSPQQNSGIRATLTGILASFEIGVGLPGNFSLSATGKFGLDVANLVVEVPDVAIARADRVMIQYDPAAADDQELVRVDRASITFPKFNLTGEITPFDPVPNAPDNPLVPGLVVRRNGFRLGQAQLCYRCSALPTGTQALSTTPGASDTIRVGPLTLQDVRIGVTNFGVDFASGVQFDGAIFIASGGAALDLPGIDATISDRVAADDRDADGRQNTEAVRLDIDAGAFTGDGKLDQLQFSVDTLDVEVASGFFILTARDFVLRPEPLADENIVTFGAIGARLKVGALEIGGEARNFGIRADGTITAGHPLFPQRRFGVSLTAESASGAALGWPSWLPIRITELGVDFEVHDQTGQINFEEFELILSASVSGLPGVSGLNFSGAINGIRISPTRLLDGEFPVTAIESIGVSVTGQLFGGELDASLIGGILRIGNDSGQPSLIPPSDTTTEVVDRVLFMGVQGGFQMPGVGGLTIRFALSELGPLGVFLNVEVPGGILLEPFTGLTINDFAAGVEFFKTLPSIDEPEQLRNPAFEPVSVVPVDAWLDSVQAQVFNQYLALQANPNLSGFTAAFASPMLIRGSATLYSIYTSQFTFNGSVTLMLSTDGKFLIEGQLNFLDGAASLSGKLYGDFTQVTDGRVTILFLADVPDQVRLLTLDGKLELGFRNESGKVIAIPVDVGQEDSSSADDPPSASLAFPADGEDVPVTRLNDGVATQAPLFIDVNFLPGTAGLLDYESITDDDPEIEVHVTTADGVRQPLSVDPVGHPLELFVDREGLATVTLLEGLTNDELAARGVRRFRFFIDDASFRWRPGEVEVSFPGGRWNRIDGVAPVVTNEEGFTISGPTVTLVSPSAGGRLGLGQTAGGTPQIDVAVTATPGWEVFAAAPLDDPVPDADGLIQFSGPGLGTASVRGPPLLIDVSANGRVKTLRYVFDGEFVPGEVTLSVAADRLTDSGGFSNLASLQRFIVAGATAEVNAPFVAGSVGATVFAQHGFLDIRFSPATGASIDPATLIDGAAELSVVLADGTALSLADDPTQPGDLSGTPVYRYSFLGSPPIVDGPITITYLESSFADSAGVTNLQQVQTLTIESPMQTLGNLAAGGTYFLDDVNDAGNDALYPGSPDGRYIELVVTPTSGADGPAISTDVGDADAIDPSDLKVFVGQDDVTPEFTTVERVGEADETAGLGRSSRSHVRYRFFFDEDLSLAGLTQESSATLRLVVAEGAWKDSAGNVSTALEQEVTVRAGATTFFLQLEGGLTLQTAGLLDEPILSVRGTVDFEASASQFVLDFAGTFEVIYLGNIASAAGHFVLDLGSDDDSVTVGDLLADVGVTVAPENEEVALTPLPKLWGVVKLQTNFAPLRQVGIDLEAAALLQVNTTKTVKTLDLTLEGIPGDVLDEIPSDQSLVSTLDGGELPTEISNRFTSEQLGDAAGREVEVVIGGLLWRLTTNMDTDSEQQFYIQLQDEFQDASQLNADPQPKLVIRGETQNFSLEAKSLSVQAYGRAVFRLPAFVPGSNPPQPGPEWFRAQGAFALKLGVSRAELLQTGTLVLSPGGNEVFRLRAMAAVMVESTPQAGFAGRFSLAGNAGVAGVAELTGRLQAFVNTFGRVKTITPSSFLEPVLGTNAIDIPAALPILNPNYAPGGSADILIANPDPDAESGPYFVVAADAELTLLGNVTMAGMFRLAGSSQRLAVDALVATKLEVPGATTPLFSLTGSASFAIDADGFYGRAKLNADAGVETADLVPGFEFQANFVLEFNTASVAKEIRTVEFDPVTGNLLSEPNVRLAAATVRFAADGRLGFSTTDNDTAFSLVGRFQFTLAPDRLQIEAEATVAGGVAGGPEAIVGFRLSTAGLAGVVRVGSSPQTGDPIEGNGEPITGNGFELAYNFAIYVNTTNEDVTLVGVLLPNQQVTLRASGYLQFSLDGIAGFRIEGNLVVSGSTDNFSVTVDGVLLADVQGQRLLEIDASGLLKINAAGIAGRLSLTAGADSPFSATGFGFASGVSLIFEVNTTGTEVRPTAGDPLPAGVYARMHADGLLSFEVNQTGFSLDGTFDLEVGSNGLIVTTEATLLARVAGETLFRFNAEGALLIGGGGIAGRIGLTLQGGPPEGDGYRFDAGFLFEINTDTQGVDRIADQQVDLAAGPYVRLQADGDLVLRINRQGSFVLDGSFALTAGVGGLEVAADANLQAVGASGEALLQISAEGALLISSRGIAARIALNSGPGLGGAGFNFEGTFTFELNTTGGFVSAIAGQSVGLPAGPYAKLVIEGSVSLLGDVASLDGSFVLTASTARVAVDVDGSIRVLGVGFDLQADAQITAGGFALQTELELSSATSFVPINNLEIFGDLILQINTGGRSVSFGSDSIPRRTVRVAVENGGLNLLGIHATGSVEITAGAGGFRIEVPKSNPLTVDLVALNASVHGTVSSNGTFQFTGSGGINASAGPASLEANASLTLGTSDPTFRVTASGKARLEVAGQGVEVSVNASLSIRGTRLTLSASACVDLLFDDACVSVTFTIGTIAPPGPAQVDPEPVLATLLSDGTLRLNMGPFADQRDAAPYVSITQEEFFVTHAGGSANNETVRVSAFGFEKIYQGVRRIIADGGSDADVVQVSSGVLSAAELSGGGGDDQLFYFGGGSAVLDGGTGDDTIAAGGNASHILRGGGGDDSLIGGSGDDQLDGGPGRDSLASQSGNDVLIGGSGIDRIDGGGGDDLIRWRDGDGADASVDGGGEIADRLLMIFSELDDQIRIEDLAAASGFRIRFAEAVFATSGIERLTLETNGGADAVTIGTLADSPLSFIEFEMGSDVSRDRIVLQGSGDADSYRQTVLGEAVQIETAGVTVRVVRAGSGDGGASIEYATAAGNDQVTVEASLAGTQTIVETGSGSDRIQIGAAGGNLNAIAGGVNVSGGANADQLMLDDFDLASQLGVVTANRIWGFGMPGSTASAGGVGYGDIETLALRLGQGDDQVAVRSTPTSAITTIQLGGGVNQVHVSSTAPQTGGNVDAIGGELVIAGGSGEDALTVDDRDTGPSQPAFLTSERLFGLGMPGSDARGGGIRYLDLETFDLRLGERADEVNIRSTAAGTTTRVFTGEVGENQIFVGDRAPLGPSLLEGIRGTLVLVGQAERDQAIVDDSAEPNDADGELGPESLRGLGMGGDGIRYSGLESLSVLLGDGDDELLVSGTHDQSTFIAAANGADRIIIDDASGLLQMDSASGPDRLAINASQPDSVIVWSAGDGDDVLNLRGNRGAVRVFAGRGDDDFHVSDTAPVFPDSIDSPGVGRVDAIDGAVTVFGEEGFDRMLVDDSASTRDTFGSLSSTTVRGLGMDRGIEYEGADDVTVWLGRGSDVFAIESTHAAPTRVFAGNASIPDTSPDDLVAIRATTGVLSVFGQAGDDHLAVGLYALRPPEDNTRAAAANQIPREQLFQRTHLNLLGSPVNLHGGRGTDHYEVNFAGVGSAIVHVDDQNATNDDQDTLEINGSIRLADRQDAPAPRYEGDTFLLRRNFVALINDANGSGAIDVGDGVERVDFDDQIDAGLNVHGLAGNDRFVSDQTTTRTVLDGGVGKDVFQVGQVFGTPRDDDAGIAADEPFETTAVFLGVVRDASGAVLFDPVVDTLTSETVDLIRAAIAASPSGQIDGIGYVSAGVSHRTTIRGGDDGDLFSVYRNQAPLELLGEAGDDEFIVRGFVLLPGDDVLEQAETTVSGGDGLDLIQYAMNAPVAIDGGDGFDTLVVIGTAFSDNFVVNDRAIYGAGLTVEFENIEVAELDALEGEDRIFVRGTAAGLVTKLIGGFGDDWISVLSDVTEPIASTVTTFDYQPHQLKRLNGPLIVEAGRSLSTDRSLRPVVLLPGESDVPAVSAVIDRDEGESVDRLDVFDDSAVEGGVGKLTHRDDVALDNPGYALTGLGMAGDVTFDRGTDGAPEAVTYGGGVTYHGFERVEVLLGTGDDQLTIDATAFATATAVHGGGGSDTLILNEYPGTDRIFAGALVVYGDTSEDGQRDGGRYSGMPPTLSTHAGRFDHFGDDMIDASGAVSTRVIDGGPGDDTLIGGQAGDHLGAGPGNDSVDAQAGDDHIYGDASFNVDLRLVALQQMEHSDFDPAQIPAMFTIVSTLVPGDDVLAGGDGEDLIFGDHGQITQTQETIRLTSTAAVVRAETFDAAGGGDDEIDGGPSVDHVFGGLGTDVLSGGDGDDFVAGDHALATFDLDTSTAARVTNRFAVTEPTRGDSDTIFGNAGNDVLFGGTGGDLIEAGDGDDLAFGDHGDWNRQRPVEQRFLSLFVTAEAGGGDDVIRGGSGDDVLMGQQGTDQLEGDAGEDDLTGGHNVPFGYDGGDTIRGGDNADVILGDNGQIRRTQSLDDNSLWQRYAAPFPWVIRQIERYDLRDGQGGGDELFGDDGQDILVGQNGDDTIHGGDGDDQASGDAGADRLSGDGGHDVLIGDVGYVVRRRHDDGTPVLAANGTWQRDVYLEMQSEITEVVDLDTTPLRQADPELARKLVESDLALAAGTFDSNATKQTNLDNGAWDTNLVLLRVRRSGNDVLAGGPGDDSLLGMGGDDRLEGGNGADLLYGDLANVVLPVNARGPLVQTGLRVHPNATGVADNHFLIPEYGVTLPPQHWILPPEVAAFDPGLTLSSAGITEALRNDPSISEYTDRLPLRDGATMTPYAAIISDVSHHESVLPGNDSISGGDGADVLYGDWVTASMPITTDVPEIDRASWQLLASVTAVMRELSYLSMDFDLWDHTVMGRPNQYAIGSGNDLLDGDAGDDLVVGDHTVHRIALPSDFSTQQARFTDSDASGWFHYLRDLERLMVDLGHVVFEAHDWVLDRLVSDAIDPGAPIATQLIDPQLHELSIGNDEVSGGGGDDWLIGDDAALVSAPLTDDGFSDLVRRLLGISDQNESGLRAALRDLERQRRSMLDLHVAAHHDDYFHRFPSADALLRLPFDFGIRRNVGNDRLTGGLGKDVIVGDVGAAVTVHVTEAGVSLTTQQQIDDAFGMISRQLLQEELFEGAHHDEMDRSLTNVSSHQWRDIGQYSLKQILHNDQIDAGADDDVAFGDHAAFGTVLTLESAAAVGELASNALDYKALENGLEGRLNNFKHLQVDQQKYEDTIRGGDGEDRLSGSLGDDSIDGQTGTDDLVGGPGVDVFIGPEPDDRLNQEGSTQAARTSGYGQSLDLWQRVIANTRIPRTQLESVPVAFAPTDVNRDGLVTPLDALLVINWLARPQTDPAAEFPSGLDVTGDGRVSPLDALRVINRLSRVQLSTIAVPEGEGTRQSDPKSPDESRKQDVAGELPRALFHPVRTDLVRTAAIEGSRVKLGVWLQTPLL